MDIKDRLMQNPPTSVVDMQEHEMYWSLINDITENNTQLNYNDRHSLGLLAVSICEMNRLSQDLKNRGEQLEVEGDRGMVTKKNASRDALEKLRSPVLRLMKEFKMTPASRGGKQFGVTGSNNPDDGFNEV